MSVQVPQSHIPHWSEKSDSALWQAVVSRDSIFVIGLKAPGRGPGVVRGKVTLLHDEWNGAAHSLMNRLDVQIVSVDTVHLPVVRMKLLNVGVLGVVRRLPFVDFVEPNQMQVTYMDGCDEFFGGSSGSSSGSDGPYGEALLPVYTSTGGTDYISHTFSDMDIDLAWQVGTGRGITIGITDTGLDQSQSSEFNPAYFASGDSYGRSLGYADLMGDTPTCSHGTRIAGLAAAPRDGRNVVGAAYGANLYAVHQADGTNPDVNNAADAIHEAVVSGGAKVVVMAWGELNWYDNVANEIASHYYNDDVMFVGAAGTCPIGSYCPNLGSAVFPAEMGEVLAVTGANSDGSRPSNMYDYGSKTEGIVAYTNLGTTGLNTDVITAIGGSSAATGVMGGIAAFVRARYPSLTNLEVVNRLIATSGAECAGAHPAVWRDAMVNAYAALGGICITRNWDGTVSGPKDMSFYDGNSMDSTVTYSVRAYQGFGPIAYRWMTGETTSSIQQFFSSNDANLEPRTIWVEIRDTGTSNPALHLEFTVPVQNFMSTSGGGCVIVPPAISC